MSNDIKASGSRFILWRLLDVLERIFCIIPVVVMTVIVFLAVVFRYVLKSPIGWSEEVTLICMTWCVFGAASYAFYNGINVGVTFLVDRIGGRRHDYLVKIVINFMTIVFFAVLMYASLMTLRNVTGKFTMAAHIPMVIPYSAMPVGCAMCILRLIEMILDQFRFGRGSAEEE